MAVRVLLSSNEVRLGSEDEVDILVEFLADRLIRGWRHDSEYAAERRGLRMRLLYAIRRGTCVVAYSNGVLVSAAVIEEVFSRVVLQHMLCISSNPIVVGLVWLYLSKYVIDNVAEFVVSPEASDKFSILREVDGEWLVDEQKSNKAVDALFNVVEVVDEL